jgi:trans-aconitate 2-methyltransferase
MERVVEPELMDEAGQVAAYAEADFAASDQALVERLAAVAGPRTFARAVDLGCGPGNITFRLQARFPGLELLGLDGAPSMIAAAQARAGAAGPRFEVRRFPGVDAPRDRDLVVSNSLLHHLHEPAVLWAEVRRWAAPGAFVFVADLYRPTSTQEALRLVERYTAGAPGVLRTDFHNSLLAAFDDAELRGQLEAAGLGHFTVEYPDDRHVFLYGALEA